LALGVFLAGGLGATLRVGLAGLIERGATDRLPSAGTLTVNLIGCFLIGVLAPILTGHARVVVLGGFLGGLTTYSAFALLTAELGAEARWSVLGFQLLAHLLGGVLFVAAGIALARVLGFR
jgi:CrcB protein